MIPYPLTNNYFMFYPFLPPNCDKPPTLYAVLNSIVNGTKDPSEYTKIKNLAKEGRTTIFNFEYPLSENISKEKFETMILNHFLQRRIGFETVTAFRIQLDVKLNDIMPLYNKMFDALENWDIFNDGEVTTRTGTDNKTQNSTTHNTNEASNSLSNHSTTETTDISDRRNSELPQSEIENIQNASYLTNYNYDTNNNSGEDNSTSTGTSQATNHETHQGTDNTAYNETIRRSPADKIAILKEMQENIKTIYSMIFKDLDCLFYQLL